MLLLKLCIMVSEIYMGITCSDVEEGELCAVWWVKGRNKLEFKSVLWLCSEGAGRGGEAAMNERSEGVALFSLKILISNPNTTQR